MKKQISRAALSLPHQKGSTSPPCPRPRRRRRRRRRGPPPTAPPLASRTRARQAARRGYGLLGRRPRRDRSRGGGGARCEGAEEVEVSASAVSSSLACFLHRSHPRASLRCCCSSLSPLYAHRRVLSAPPRGSCLPSVTEAAAEAARKKERRRRAEGDGGRSGQISTSSTLPPRAQRLLGAPACARPPQPSVRGGRARSS